MKMLKKGFIALMVLGVVLFFAPFVLVNLGFDSRSESLGNRTQ